MADKPTRGRASKVWLLPESIRNALNEMLRDKGNSQAAILDEINGLIEEAGLPDELKLSRSGLSRHASQVEQVGLHLRDLRETTAALTSQLGDKPMGETTKLILELGRSQLFKAMLAQVQNPEEAVDIDMLKNAMLAAQRLESTAMQSHKREKEIRQAFAEEIAAKTEAIVTQAGLSGEAAAAIRREILGDCLMTAIAQTPIAQQLAQTLGTEYSPDEVLLPYQRIWIADESQLKIAEKSRRTGITWAEAADAALAASKTKTAGGCHHFYVGSNKEMAREFIDAVAMWAKAYNKAAGEIQEEVFTDDEDKAILTFVVYFASGFKVQALSSNPSNLRGMQGNVTIDEAAFHDRLAEVLKAAMALTMWGAKVRLISTHNGVDNLFNQLINDSRAGRKEYSIHTISLDDACRQGLYRRICQVKGGLWTQEAEDSWKAGLLKATATEEDALEEYFCVPKQSSGVYIKRTLIERAMQPDIPILRFTAPKDFELQSEEIRKAVVDIWCEENLKPCLDSARSQLSPCAGGGLRPQRGLVGVRSALPRH